MIDLAIITADLAHDRVAEQFDGPAVTAAARRGPVRRASSGPCGRSPTASSPRRATQRRPDEPRGMHLARVKRVIPRLDVDGGRVVKSTIPGA
jgi:hypothetical protein